MATDTNLVELFHRLLSLKSEAEQRAFLDEVAQQSAEISGKLMAMLEATHGASSFLERPSPLVHSATDPYRHLPGDTIDCYQLLERIGAGGMGEVWRARQVKHLDRIVAIKLIKPGLTLRPVLNRFAVEQQSLARMSHPGISQILDAGSTDLGNPYFVMEYVPGVHITDYCVQHRLSVPARLELFGQLCQAVQYAHQKGIVHQDLKPPNILVSHIEGRPLVKVIDFGLAKLIEDESVSADAKKQADWIWGSPLYMSPEVLRGDEARTDIRCDIYSLGVILYELLCGAHPLASAAELRMPAYELVDILLQRTAISPSKYWRSQPATAQAAHAFGDLPPRLARQLAGDLDAIVMKAIASAAPQRYTTVIELAADLQAYAKGFEVRARTPSLAYSVQKLSQRHFGLAIATCLCMALILTGTATTLWQAAIARHERDRAIEQSHRADDQALAEKKRAAELESVSNFQRDMLWGMNATEAGAELIHFIVQRYETELGRHHELTEADRDKIDQLKKALQLASPTEMAYTVFDHALIEPAVPLLEQQFADQPMVHIKLMQQLVYQYQLMSRFDKAQKLQEELLLLVKDTYGADSPDYYAALGVLGNQLHLQSQFTKSVELLQEASEGMMRTAGIKDKRTLRAMADYSTALGQTKQEEEQEKAIKTVLQLIADNFPEDRKMKLDVLNSYGMLLEKQGRMPEALLTMEQSLAECRELFGEEHRDTLNSLNNLGSLYLNLNMLDKAEATFREALEKRTRVLGAEHSGTITVMVNLGRCLCDERKLDEAVPLLEDAVAISRKTLKDTHAKTLAAISNLCRAYLLVGRLDESETLSREYLKLSENGTPSDRSSAKLRLGAVLDRKGQNDEAEALLLKCYSELREQKAKLSKLRECVEALVQHYRDVANAQELEKWNAVQADLNK